MVCTLNHRRMAAMVKLLATRTHLETTAEEATYEKLSFQAIRREFHEADEANLLDEEDMYMFDSRPMSDPLHLDDYPESSFEKFIGVSAATPKENHNNPSQPKVSCNGCKKPIKASQYAAHAERCRALNHLEGTLIELGGGHKKSRKGRKKLHTLHDNQESQTAEHEKSESIDGDGINGSESNLDEHAGSMSTLSREVKRIMSNVPTPLATKIYYLGGSYRLRAALNRLYGQSEARDLGNSSTLKVMQDNNMLVVSRRYSSKNPDQSSSQGSELYIGGSGAYISDVTSPNHFQEGDFSRPGRSRSNMPLKFSSGN